MNTWRQGSISIREARPRDLEAIGRLENESFETDRVSRRSLREFLRAPHRPVIAATIDDELAGYILVSLRKGARARPEATPCKSRSSCRPIASRASGRITRISGITCSSPAT